MLFEFPKHLLYISKADLVICLFIYSLIHVHGHLFISHIKMAILKFLMNVESSVLHEILRE